MPEYLSQMYSLKENDPETWQYFEEGNFVVNRNTSPFYAIGSWYRTRKSHNESSGWC